MSSSDLGIGIVGASISGGWALESHLPAVTSTPGVRLAAVATTRPETARATALAYGGAGYTDPAALAADPAVDVVSIVVRVPEHRAALDAVLAAGKTVYCEWPLGVSTEEAAAIASTASAPGAMRVIGLQARLQPAVRELRQQLASGAIGELVAVEAASVGMGHGAPRLPASKEWVADDRNGMSALTVRAAHTLDAIAFAVGPVRIESAQVDARAGRVLIDGEREVRKTSPDRVAIRGRVAGGVPLSAMFLLGAHALDRTPLVTVYGTEGTLSIVSDELAGQIQMSRLRLVRQVGSRVTTVLLRDPLGAAGPESGAARTVARMYAALADEARHAELPTFADALELHRLLDAVRSAR
jgi:predicted dehydrogenase